MWRSCTARNKHKYIDTLDDLILSYNNTLHRSIKTKPALVNADNADEVLNELYGGIYSDKFTSNYKFKFKVGDIVRYRVWKDMRFDKGYTQNWTEEVFTVCERLPRVLPVYRLKEDNGSEMDAFYYEQELLSINREPDPLFLVQNILERKRINGVMHAHVKWLGYPTYYNSWVPNGNLINIHR